MTLQEHLMLVSYKHTTINVLFSLLKSQRKAFCILASLHSSIRVAFLWYLIFCRNRNDASGKTRIMKWNTTEYSKESNT